jgi:hypothetical protein
MSFFPLKARISDQLELEFGDLESAQRAKNLKKDSALPEYYSETEDYSDGGVVRVGHMEGVEPPVIEKKADLDEEIMYHILADEVGIAPEILGVRFDEDVDSPLYVMNFLEEYGMPEDNVYRSLGDFLGYVESAASNMAALHKGNIMHGDFVRTEGQADSDWQGTTFLTNMMFPGAPKESRVIDFEYTHFEGLNHGGGPEWLNPSGVENIDQEKEAVLFALQCVFMRNFYDDLTQNNGGDLEFDDIFDFDDIQNDWDIDVSDEVDESVERNLQDIEDTFNRVYRDTNPAPGRIYMSGNDSVIPVQEEVDDYSDAMRKRFLEIEQFWDDLIQDDEA